MLPLTPAVHNQTFSPGLFGRNSHVTIPFLESFLISKIIPGACCILCIVIIIFGCAIARFLSRTNIRLSIQPGQSLRRADSLTLFELEARVECLRSNDPYKGRLRCNRPLYGYEALPVRLRGPQLPRLCCSALTGTSSSDIGLCLDRLPPRSSTLPKSICRFSLPSARNDSVSSASSIRHWACSRSCGAEKIFTVHGPFSIC